MKGSMCIELAKLYVEFLQYVQLGWAAGYGCPPKEGWNVGDCCETHRLLVRKYESLIRRAMKFVESGEDAALFSQAWWEVRGFGFENGYSPNN